MFTTTVNQPRLDGRIDLLPEDWVVVGVEDTSDFDVETVSPGAVTVVENTTVPEVIEDDVGFEVEEVFKHRAKGTK